MLTKLKLAKRTTVNRFSRLPKVHSGPHIILQDCKALLGKNNRAGPPRELLYSKFMVLLNLAYSIPKLVRCQTYEKLASTL